MLKHGPRGLVADGDSGSGLVPGSGQRTLLRLLTDTLYWIRGHAYQASRKHL